MVNTKITLVTGEVLELDNFSYEDVEFFFENGSRKPNKEFVELDDGVFINPSHIVSIRIEGEGETVSPKERTKRIQELQSKRQKLESEYNIIDNEQKSE